MLVYLLDENTYIVLQGQIISFIYFNLFVKPLKNTNFAKLIYSLLV